MNDRKKKRKENIKSSLRTTHPVSKLSSELHNDFSLLLSLLAKNDTLCRFNWGTEQSDSMRIFFMSKKTGCSWALGSSKESTFAVSSGNLSKLNEGLAASAIVKWMELKLSFVTAESDKIHNLTDYKKAKAKT